MNVYKKVMGQFSNSDRKAHEITRECAKQNKENMELLKKIGERAKMVEHYEKKRLELEKKSVEEEKYMKIREEAQMRLWELGVQSIAEEESENMAPGEKEPSSRG